MHLSILKRVSRLTAICATGVFLVSGICSAANFTADMITKFGKMTMTGKLYVSGNKWRQETRTPEGKQIIICRADKGKTWIINPDKKQYQEQSRAAKSWSATSMQSMLGKDTVRKAAGKQNINGLNCDKYIFTSKNKGSASSITQYVCKELDLPVKTEIKMKQGAMSVEFKNVKKTNSPASLFELPRGYAKMKMPAFYPPQGRRPGPGRK